MEQEDSSPDTTQKDELAQAMAESPPAQPCVLSEAPIVDSKQEIVTVTKRESPESDDMNEGFVMVDSNKIVDEPTMASEQKDLVGELIAAELASMDAMDISPETSDTDAGVNAADARQDTDKALDTLPSVAPESEKLIPLEKPPKLDSDLCSPAAAESLVLVDSQSSDINLKETPVTQLESPDDMSTDRDISTEHQTSEKDVSTTADSLSQDSSIGRAMAPLPLQPSARLPTDLIREASSSDETSYGNDLSTEETGMHPDAALDHEHVQTKTSADSMSDQQTICTQISPPDVSIAPQQTSQSAHESPLVLSQSSSINDVRTSESAVDESSEFSEPERPFDIMVGSQTRQEASIQAESSPLALSQPSLSSTPAAKLSDKDSALDTSFDSRADTKEQLGKQATEYDMRTHGIALNIKPVAESSPNVGRQQDALHRIDRLMETLKSTGYDTESSLAGSLAGSDAVSMEDMDGSDLGVMEDITGEYAEDETPSLGPKVEVTIPGEKGEKDRSFTVDESFVTERGRRKKKHRSGHRSDSSFTISTPSGSLHSISSISEMESTPASLGASLDDNIDDNLSISRLVDSREQSVSIDGLLACNADAEELKALWAQEDKGQKDVTLVTEKSASWDSILQSDRTLLDGERSVQNGSLGHERGRASMNVTAENSQYYTPNTSADSRDKHVLLSSEEPHSSSEPNSISSASGDKSGSPLRSPGISIVDAKRRFMFEPPQPVRIDPKLLFTDLRTPEGLKQFPGQSPRRRIHADRAEMEKENKVPGVANGSYPAEHGRKKIAADPELMRDWRSVDEPRRKAGGLDLRKDWQSVDHSGTLSSPTAGIPPKDTVNGEMDVFYTPAASSEYVFKKPAEPMRRKLPPTPMEATKVDPSKKKYSKDEIKLLKEADRERARQEARQRARLMSDEELGIDFSENVTPSNVGKSDSLNKTKTDSVSKSSKSKTLPAQRTPYKDDKPLKPTQLDMTPHRPLSQPPLPKHVDFKALPDSKSMPMDSKHVRTASESSSKSHTTQRTTSESSTVSSEPTPRVRRTEGVLSDTEGHSPSFLRRGKKNKKESGSKTPDFFRDESSKSEDEKKGGTLKKEKRKSFISMFMPKSDKKDKVKSPKSPKEKKTPDQKKASTEKKFGVKLRQRMKSPKPQEEKDKEAEKRGSMYDEFQPLFEELGVSEVHAKEHIQERLAAVAPNVPKSTPVLAPRATAEDLDTESEMGDPDTRSIRSFQSQGMTEEDIAKMLRRQQKYAARRQREQELKRLRTAQEIQRQLEEVEIKQRDIERKGIAIERALRGEGPEAERNEGQLMQDWFNVVHEKNVLVRYESELMVHARELELEDRHSRLDIQLRDLMTIEESQKTSEQKEEEKRILEELLEVVEQRNALVTLLEEDRLREQEQDKDLMEIMMGKGFQLSPATYVNQLRPLLKEPANQKTER